MFAIFWTNFCFPLRCEKFRFYCTSGRCQGRCWEYWKWSIRTIPWCTTNFSEPTIRKCMGISRVNWHLDLDKFHYKLFQFLNFFVWQFEEEAKLVARYQVPGRPTCLTVVGRKSTPAKVETTAEAMVVEPAQTAKGKMKKEKGKADRRTTSTSGNLLFILKLLVIQFKEVTRVPISPGENYPLLYFLNDQLEFCAFIIGAFSRFSLSTENRRGTVA